MKYVQARDAGVYECQVGTEPKMSHFVQLNVVGEYRCLLSITFLYFDITTSAIHSSSELVRTPGMRLQDRILKVVDPTNLEYTYYLPESLIKFVVSTVPKIEIVGESDLYVKAGTTVSLKCVITQALEEPAYIFWYHNDERVLNYDKSLVEIRMERVAPDTTVRALRTHHYTHSHV